MQRETLQQTPWIHVLGRDALPVAKCRRIERRAKRIKSGLYSEISGQGEKSQLRSTS